MNDKIRQAIIEDMAGITDKEFADYISLQSTVASKRVINLIKMLIDFYEPAGMELLRCAVEDCRKEYMNSR